MTRPPPENTPNPRPAPRRAPPGTLFAAALHPDETQPDPAPGFFLHVAVERGIDTRSGRDARTARGVLTYSADAPVPIGERVEVPLGPAGRPESGIVVASGGSELLGSLDPLRVRPIGARTGAALTPPLVDLARWMSDYYVCPLGMVLASMMPSAVKRATGRRVFTMIGLGPNANDPEAVRGLTPKGRAAWAAIAALDSASLPMPVSELLALAGLKTAAPLKRLVAAGLLKETEQEEVRASGRVWNQASGSSESDAHAGAEPSAPAPRDQSLTLTDEQQHAVAGIAGSLGAFGVHLLRGVTGSGKTEVYLRVIEHALTNNPAASVIVLVPEIALTPQTAGRFLARFAPRSGGMMSTPSTPCPGVAVLHSGLSASQRHKEWDRVARGEARVVVGARSALFAPVRNLSLIVVDEEHASDYKQDQLPRYHARDAAVKRAHIENCPIVLGSATPSLESWANARSGKYRLWELTRRVPGGRMPRVEIVDLAEDLARLKNLPFRPGVTRSVGATLGAALVDTLHAGGQAILLINRRGFASYIACTGKSGSPPCGWSMRCDDCDASMVVHLRSGTPNTRAGNFVRCHHCQAEQLTPRACPVCAGRIGLLGTGTQRIEEELARDYGLTPRSPRELAQAAPPGPAAPTGPVLIRVDGDTMNSAGDYFDALAAFARGRAHVLVGTQMIAKGLDYPNVRLVGVIDADTALSLPDFRAAERTFQLISQVAGRAGRGEHAGRVIVQTRNPEFSPIRLAAEHDFTGFAEEELQTRTHAGLPPATRLARIVVRDEDYAKAKKHADEVLFVLREAIDVAPDSPPAVTITGPMDCPVARVAAHHRIEIQLTSASRGAIQGALAHARSRGFLKSDSRTAIDVDPIALM